MVLTTQKQTTNSQQLIRINFHSSTWWYHLYKNNVQSPNTRIRTLIDHENASNFKTVTSF